MKLRIKKKIFKREIIWAVAEGKRLKYSLEQYNKAANIDQDFKDKLLGKFNVEKIKE